MPRAARLGHPSSQRVCNKHFTPNEISRKDESVTTPLLQKVSDWVAVLQAIVKDRRQLCSAEVRRQKMTDMPKAQVEPTEVQPLPKHCPLAELVRGQGLVEPSAPNALLRPLCSSHSQLLGLRRSRILRATRPVDSPHSGKEILPELPHPRPHRRRRCLRHPHAALGAQAARSR